MSRVAETAREIIQATLDANKKICRVEVVQAALVSGGFTGMKDDLQQVRDLVDTFDFVYGEGFVWERSTESVEWSL